MAERVGFEPTVELPRRMLSKHVDSATLAPLRDFNPREAGILTWGGGSGKARLVPRCTVLMLPHRRSGDDPKSQQDEAERRLARLPVLADQRFLPTLVDLAPTGRADARRDDLRDGETVKIVSTLFQDVQKGHLCTRPPQARQDAPLPRVRPQQGTVVLGCQRSVVRSGN